MIKDFQSNGKKPFEAGGQQRSSLRAQHTLFVGGKAGKGREGQPYRFLLHVYAWVWHKGELSLL